MSVSTMSAVPYPPGLFIVDAHQDLAYHCQEHSRDLVDPGLVECMITLPWLIDSNVRLVCGTLFTPHVGTPDERRTRIEQQYEMYQSWFTQYPQVFRLIQTKSELADLAAADEVDFFSSHGRPVGVILLMEGCELLESPPELELWHRRGLRMASLTWNGVNKYACGTFGIDTGLTPLGQELLAEFKRLGMTLDVSHLSDRSLEDVFDNYDGFICASHSNSRSVAESARNLTDAQAQEVSRRGGVIGLNLLASFVRGGWKDGDALPSVSDTTEHVQYLSGLSGSAAVGLGSDLDGGLTAANTPEGINRIGHLVRLLDDLRRRGWNEQQLFRFAGRNWWDFFERCLPD